MNNNLLTGNNNLLNGILHKINYTFYNKLMYFPI